MDNFSEYDDSTRKNLRVLYWSCTVLISFIAFEMLAISTAMTKVTEVLHGKSLYSLSFGVALAGQLTTTVMSGVWCDRRGPRPSLLLGVNVFVAGLLISGLATNMDMLVAGRALQGLGGGLCVVPLYVIIGEAVPRALQPKFFAAFATAWVVPALIGPVLAGMMVDAGYWRAVFLIVPVLLALSMIVVIPLLLRLPLRTGRDPKSDHSSTRPVPIFIGGAIIVGLGMGVLYVFGTSSTPQLLILIPVAILILAVLPTLIPPGTLILKRGLSSCIVSRVFINGAFVAAEIYLPLYLVRCHYTYTKAGLVLTVSSITWAIGSVWQGTVKNARIRSLVPLLGCLLGVCGAVLTALSSTPLLPPWVMFISWTFVGLGVGAAFPTLTVFALSLAEPGRSGQVSSAIQLADTLGGALGIAITGTIASTLSFGWDITGPLIVTASLLLLACFLASRATLGIEIEVETGKTF